MILNKVFCMGNMYEKEVAIFMKKLKFKYFIKNALNQFQ